MGRGTHQIWRFSIYLFLEWNEMITLHNVPMYVTLHNVFNLMKEVFFRPREISSVSYACQKHETQTVSCVRGTYIIVKYIRIP